MTFQAKGREQGGCCGPAEQQKPASPCCGPAPVTGQNKPCSCGGKQKPSSCC